MARRRATNEVTLEFAFFNALWYFYQANRKKIRSSYKELTRKFLDFNNPEKNPKAFLREPQYEALEVYIFLKEFLHNAKVELIFKEWFEKAGPFAGRLEGGVLKEGGQARLFDTITEEQYSKVFELMRRNSRDYPNYIFALTMGTGKTILMATCIFYEFLLGNKYDKDPSYCHNALVFAPDKTVLHSLKEIEEFDLNLVVPPEYVNFLATHLRFHYLEESGTSLDTLDRSRFNIIVSNTQKIILKRSHKEKNSVERLFGATPYTPAEAGVYADAADLYAFDEPEEEAELTTNQRFEKLCRLEQLGIYVDEAHHAFGKNLAKDMGIGSKENDTSLRTTIDMLSVNLKKTGTRVVACYNYTGTPYVGRQVLPEVVYAYGLREAIGNGYLKKVVLHGYTNTRCEEFVRFSIEEFLSKTEGLMPEGMRPKMAFFAATIEELECELRPAVEKVLIANNIPLSRILVNVGDETITNNDDIREFRRLDTPESDKQYILLVNKGREGWNCRSLFSVGLFREPKSRIFVLQSTMRCLRSIGEAQYIGHVFLSEDNFQTLNEELLENFRISAKELEDTAKDRERVEVRVVEPPVKIKLVRVRRHFDMHEKKIIPGHSLGLDREDRDFWNALTEKYRIFETQREGLSPTNATLISQGRKHDLTERREKRVFSHLMLISEISRYLNRSPLEIEHLLDSTKEGTENLVSMVNEFNELLYDEIIPRLFAMLFELQEFEETEEHDVELIKIPPKGYYELSAAKDKIIHMDDVEEMARSKSFHLDTYCFDSHPEQTLFRNLLREQRVSKIYFTGMLTHGQTDFFIQYIDPDSRTVRSYYPDFIFLRNETDGGEKYVIVEVKRDDQIDDAVVKAKKDFANQIAVASGMEYQIIKATDAQDRRYECLM